MNITIEIPEEHKDKWVLCATPKHGYAYNSLLFWGKKNCGYYPDLNKCQLYTEEEVHQRADKVNIPIKLVELVKYFAPHVEHASEQLGISKTEYLARASKDGE